MNKKYFKKTAKQLQSEFLYDFKMKFGMKHVVVQKYENIYRVIIFDRHDFSKVIDNNFYDIGDFFNAEIIFGKKALDINDKDLDIVLKTQKASRTLRMLLYKAFISEEIEATRYGYCYLNHAVWIGR